jgi:hypothetical protein
LPVVVGLADLLLAAFGYYWDVAWHIEKGRDELIFTAPHTLIIIGLLGVGMCGLLAHTLFWRASTPGGVRMLGWRTPPGAALLIVCGLFAVAGFPLDDLWHHFFGEDVTAWGPTHLLMISGAALSPVALAMLLAHGRRVAAGEASRGFKPLAALVASAMLVGLSAYQAEFDFGVPQFQLLYHPVLIALAGGIVLVAARSILGPGGALVTAITFVLIRGAVDIGLVAAGRGVARFPTYLAAAVVVEIAAHYGARRSVRAPLVAGVGIGTVGLLGEAALLNLWGYHPWTSRVLLVGMVLGSVAAVAAAVVGRAIAAWLRTDVPRTSFGVVVAASAVIVAVLAVPLPRTTGAPPAASIRLSPASAVEEAGGSAERWVNVTVDMESDAAVEDADWFEVMAWQGGSQVVAPLEAMGQGYRTTRRVPIGGSWKTLLRLAKGSQIVGTPLYLPADPEIGAQSFEPRPAFSAKLQLDSKLLLREARGGPTWALVVGYGTVIAVAAIWIGLIFWGLTRLHSDDAT